MKNCDKKEVILLLSIILLSLLCGCSNQETANSTLSGDSFSYSDSEPTEPKTDSSVVDSYVLFGSAFTDKETATVLTVLQTYRDSLQNDDLKVVSDVVYSDCTNIDCGNQFNFRVGENETTSLKVFCNVDLDTFKLNSLKSEYDEGYQANALDFWEKGDLRYMDASTDKVMRAEYFNAYDEAVHNHK